MAALCGAARPADDHEDSGTTQLGNSVTGAWHVHAGYTTRGEFAELIPAPLQWSFCHLFHASWQNAPHRRQAGCAAALLGGSGVLIVAVDRLLRDSSDSIAAGSTGSDRRLTWRRFRTIRRPDRVALRFDDVAQKSKQSRLVESQRTLIGIESHRIADPLIESIRRNLLLRG